MISEIETSNLYLMISFLLQYPNQTMLEALPEIKEEVEASGVSIVKQDLSEFLRQVTSASFDEWVDHYIDHFDFGKLTNLYVTYLKLGEQRERGLELLKLKKFYEEAGYTVTDKELPDYLPLMLEFCGNASMKTGLELMAMHIKSIQEIREKLKESGSYYVLLFDALMNLLESNGLTLPKEEKISPEN